MSMPLPSWVNQLKIKYTSGVAHAFVLHFNVADMVTPGVSLTTYLSKLVLGTPESPLMDLVIFYDRAHGFQFPVPSMKARCIEILGLDQESQDPMLAALGGSAGSLEPDLPRSPSEALPLLDQLLHLPDTRSAIFVTAAETIVPDADLAMMSSEDRTNLVTITSWGNDPDIAGLGNMVALVTSNLSDLHQQIRAASAKFEAILVDLPDRERRAAFITLTSDRFTFEWIISPNELANASAGLGLNHIHDVLLRAEQAGRLTGELVRERKQDIIASEYAAVLEIMEPRFGWEAVGGMAHIKQFFERSVILPMAQANTRRIPMGILMTGPAGTGKSIVAEAVAREAGVNAVVLNLARIFGQYVGNSERNLEKALQAIKSLAPTIVFIDEIDQSVSRGGGGDSGVSSRIFKRLLEFMSDTGNRGQVLFLAATNRPDLLDAALRRPGRFDKKIPFLIPDESERAAIISVMAARYRLAITAAPAGVIAATEGWTGAELEMLVIKAIELTDDEGLDPDTALAQAAQRVSPSTADIEFMTMLAVKECNDTDLLPPRYRTLLADRTDLDRRIDESKPDRTRRLNL